MSVPVVTVIIVNHDSGACLARCLRALADQTWREFEAIVIDNGSRDDSFVSARAALAADARFEFDVAGANLGFAAANNRAAHRARGAWLALLNPDAFAAPDWLATLLDATHRHPQATLFGSTQIDARDPDRLDGCGDVYSLYGDYWRGGQGAPTATLPPEGEVFSPCAAAALYRRDQFLVLGGFDERFFCIGEDVDYGYRARLTGARAIQVRAAVVHHIGSASMGRRTDFTLYHATRNMVWVLVKNTPLALLPWLVPAYGVLTLLRLAAGCIRGGAWVRLRALGDALRALGPMLAERRRVQALRAVSTWQLLRAMTWSLPRLVARAPDVRAAAPR